MSLHFLQCASCFHTMFQKSGFRERNRLLSHEISARSHSGRALGFELRVEPLRTLLSPPWSVLVAFETCRRMGTATPDGHVTFLGLLNRETLSLFHCVYRFARNLTINGNFSQSNQQFIKKRATKKRSPRHRAFRQMRLQSPQLQAMERVENTWL